MVPGKGSVTRVVETGTEVEREVVTEETGIEAIVLVKIRMTGGRGIEVETNMKDLPIVDMGSQEKDDPTVGRKGKFNTS